MKEIYRNSSQFVYLDLYGTTADAEPIAVLKRAGSADVTLQVDPDTPPTGVQQRYKAYIPLSGTQTEGVVSVVWNLTAGGEPATVTHKYVVITPLVTVEEARDDLEIPISVTDAQIRRQERIVRAIIENYCGQSFGLEHGFETVSVSKSGTLIQLPRHLVNLTSVSYGVYAAPSSLYVISGDGWYLQSYYTANDLTLVHPSLSNPPDSPPIVREGGVIVVPGEGDYINFVPGVPYSVEGDWGWEDVPVPVAEAAKLLIEDSLCPDSVYRDRGIANIRAADWRYEFRDQAFTGTGNIKADELLEDYRINEMAVI